VDLGILGQIHFTWEFFLGFVSIIIIDLILAGDNAVVIAMAVRSLPVKQRMRGIVFGAGAAVILRIALTFFAAQLLMMQYVKLTGGALILWIAVRLFVEGAPEDDSQREAKSLWQALWVIVIADITMSTDNVLAVAAASKGNFFLLLFGLGLSIPFVVFTSTLLSKLMDKYPMIIYIGAAILGRVGGEMMVTDPFIVSTFDPPKIFQYITEAFFTVGVVIAGKLLIKLKISRQAKALGESPHCDNPNLEKES
jgi:YjbE family integral membrane protein